jgi:hypothetical protein
LINWTSNKIAALSSEQIKSLRSNADGKDQAIVGQCDAELANRKPKKSTPAASGGSVIGFHFVCDRGQGVMRDASGNLWAGTWVVDKRHAEKAAKISAYVALHAAKADPSYIQGIVKDWRVGKRERQYAEDQITKIDTGIDFLIEVTGQPYNWVGDGSGEKGNAWSGDSSDAT